MAKMAGANPWLPWPKGIPWPHGQISYSDSMAAMAKSNSMTAWQKWPHWQISCSDSMAAMAKSNSMAAWPNWL